MKQQRPFWKKWMKIHWFQTYNILKKRTRSFFKQMQIKQENFSFFWMKYTNVVTLLTSLGIQMRFSHTTLKSKAPKYWLQHRKDGTKVKQIIPGNSWQKTANSPMICNHHPCQWYAEIEINSENKLEWGQEMTSTRILST